jgi:hypothetical protein
LRAAEAVGDALAGVLSLRLRPRPVPAEGARGESTTRADDFEGLAWSLPGFALRRARSWTRVQPGSIPHREIAAVRDESGGYQGKPRADLPSYLVRVGIGEITHTDGPPARLRRDRELEVGRADEPEGDQHERDAAERGDGCARPEPPGRWSAHCAPERESDGSEGRQQEDEIDNRERLERVAVSALARGGAIALKGRAEVSLEAVPVDGEHDHEQRDTGKTGDQLAPRQVPEVEDQGGANVPVGSGEDGAIHAKREVGQAAGGAL